MPVSYTHLDVYKRQVLGEARFPSPLPFHVSDKARVLFNVIVDPDAPPKEEFLFEVAGPREKLYFDPKETRAGIVTCGGLCPGLNNVIRSLVLELHHGYGAVSYTHLDVYKRQDFL